MESHTNAFNTSQLGPGAEHSSPILLQPLFIIFAALAFLGNGLLCVVILCSPVMRRSSYNLLILNLAVTDMLAGIFMLATPSFVLTLESYPVHGELGKMFCRVVGSQFLVYVLGKVSVFEVTCLAVERWYSVVRPLIHVRKFTRRRVHSYVTVMWLLSCFCHASMPFEMALDEHHGRCAWVWASYHKSALIMAFALISFFIPTIVTWVTYLHIMIALKKSPSNNRRAARFTLMKYRLLRMCVLAAMLLTFCWLPNQVYYMLSAFEVTRLETPFHRFTIVLAMLNSCVNPWIYCFSNREYRRRFVLLLCPFTRRVPRGRRRSYDLQVRALPKRDVAQDGMPVEAGTLLSFRQLSVK